MAREAALLLYGDQLRADRVHQLRPLTIHESADRVHHMQPRVRRRMLTLRPSNGHFEHKATATIDAISDVCQLHRHILQCRRRRSGPAVGAPRRQRRQPAL